MTRRNSDAVGSGESSTTWPSAATKLMPVRIAEATAWTVPESWSANAPATRDPAAKVGAGDQWRGISAASEQQRDPNAADQHEPDTPRRAAMTRAMACPTVEVDGGELERPRSVASSHSAERER